MTHFDDVALIEKVKGEMNLNSLMAEITLLHDSTATLVSMIDGGLHKDVVSFKYSTTMAVDAKDHGSLAVLEELVYEKADDTVKQFKFLGAFTPVADHLNDRVDYTCEGYTEAKKLNEIIHTVALKYNDLFEETNKKIAATMQGHALNMILIHKNILKLHTKVVGDKSRLERISAQIAAINETLKELAVKDEVTFSFSFGYFGESTLLIQPHDINTVVSWVPAFHFPVLLYKSSVDGKSAAQFHKMCDNKGPSVTLVKTKEGCVFGAYTDINFTSAKEGYATSTESFLFTVSNSAHIPMTRFDLNKLHTATAVYNGKALGPTFGGGNDVQLFIGSDKPSTCAFPHTYVDTTGLGAALFGGKKFEVEEIEVFGV